MSGVQEVDVFVAPDGTVRLEVRGLKGQGCLALTAETERLLGGLIVDRQPTDELDQGSEQEVSQAQPVGNRK